MAWYRAQPSAPCIIESCGRPAHSRGWCSVHYQRWYVHGDPLFIPSRSVSKPKPKRRKLTSEVTPEQRERKRKADRERAARKRAEDPQYRASRRAYNQLPEVRARRREGQRANREGWTSEQLRRKSTGQREWSQRPDVAERRRQQSENYYRNPEVSRKYYEENRDYILRKNAQDRVKREAGLRPVRRAERYTVAEDALVMREDLTLAAIALRLGRSYAAVSVRRNLLKKHGGPDPSATQWPDDFVPNALLYACCAVAV